MKITRLSQKCHFSYIDFAHSHALWGLGTLGRVYPFDPYQKGLTGLFSDISTLYSYIYSYSYWAHYRAHSIVHSIVPGTCTQLIIYVIKVVNNYYNNILHYIPTVRHIRISYINNTIVMYSYSTIYTIIDFFRCAIDKSSQICYSIYRGKKQ